MSQKFSGDGRHTYIPKCIERCV